MAPLTISVGLLAFEARATNWMYSNHNRRTREAREIVSPLPLSLVLSFSLSLSLLFLFSFSRFPLAQPRNHPVLGSYRLDCLANLPMPGRSSPLSTSPSERERRPANPRHWKSNNRETSFRKATISTPIEQTRFLLVIKLSSFGRVPPY